MPHYRIESPVSGAILGVYKASDTGQALHMLARDAGYDDYIDMCEQVPDGHLVAYAVEKCDFGAVYQSTREWAEARTAAELSLGSVLRAITPSELELESPKVEEPDDEQNDDESGPPQAPDYRSVTEQQIDRNADRKFNARHGIYDAQNEADAVAADFAYDTAREDQLLRKQK